MMEFLFPEYRLDWFGAGPSSPNKTGALLAILFVVAWWPALRFRWGFWLSLPLAFVSMGLLLQTESRGALVAAGAAVVLLVGAADGSVFRLGGFRFSVKRRQTTPTQQAGHPSFKRRGVDWSRWGVGVLASVLLFAYAHALGVNERMAGMASGEDGSSNVRVALYSAGLKMIADAPMGWGHGQAGNAYGQWYQVVGDSRSYLSLVNSHLTWMADYGMVFQLGYISGWVLVLVVCWPFKPMRGRKDAIGMASLQQDECSDVALATSSAGCGDATSVASLQECECSDVALATSLGRREDATGVVSLRMIAFASWIVLGVCGFFSSVLTLLWLWCIPVALLLLCLFQRFRFTQWPTKKQWLIAGSAALLGFVGLQTVAHAFARGNHIAASPAYIEIGERPEAVAILQPDRRILGDKYGHTIREYFDVIGGATVFRSTAGDAELDGFETVVFSGQVPELDLAEFRGKIILLNPAVEQADALAQTLVEHSVTVVVGGLGDWRRVRVWAALVEGHPNWKLIELRGVAEFVPDWPKYVVTNAIEE